MRFLSLFVVGSALACAEKLPTDQLIDLAKKNGPGLEQALRDTLTDAAIQKGAAVAGEGAEFVWAVIADQPPRLQVDLLEPVAARKTGGLWFYQGQLKTGTSHKFVWIVDGKPFGGRNDIPAFTPDSYPKAGAPEGKLTGPLVHESKIYPGMKSNYWYYVPAQWDGTTPLAVQIWGDGQMYTKRMTSYRVLEALDNLTQQKKIPPMVNIFIQPGMVEQKAMRSIEYDSVNDTYVRFLLEEILPEVGKSVKLRPDGYSRAMVGESSGGICVFNAAWFKPGEISRVLSWIGSFAALQPSAAEPMGGAAYPIMVRRESKRNIRVWMQDGAEDQENPRAGSWPLANIALANSLKLKSYDYHFSFGVGTHNQAQGSAELPESLIWLWRDYDPAKTSQDFTPEPGEKDKPLWRVVTLSRN